ncbi:DoxX family protein [Streptomyces sp. YIM 98790]|uniref:DoxX family protein n=1 Tax=Streptomyces sp. YIM 98790 TaxID=2689077 RepID=UPI001407AAFA|nr:DoxX family protein [Streptomyces sp. YIM 98790]
MKSPVKILAAVASAVVIFEFSLQAIGKLALMEEMQVQFEDITGSRFPTPLTLALGAADVAGVAATVRGFRKPGYAVAAGAYFTLYTGVLLTFQLARGNSGMLLFRGALFFTSAAALLVTRAIQLSRTRTTPAPAG